MTGSHRQSPPKRTSPRRAIAAAVLLAGVLATAGFGAVLRSQLPSGPGAIGEPHAIDPSATDLPTGSPTADPTPTAAPSAGPASSAPAGPPAASRSRVEQFEDEVLALVNRERQRDGCTVMLRTDDRLHTAARGHSVDMAAHNTMSHTGSDGSSPWQRAERAGYRSAMAENVAYGYRSPASVMAGWMESDGHKRNILNCAAKAIGVGLAYSRDGTPYWTQLFGRV